MIGEMRGNEGRRVIREIGGTEDSGMRGNKWKGSSVIQGKEEIGSRGSEGKLGQ